MSDKKPLVIASILGALAPLVLAGAGWIEAKAEGERADAAVAKKVDAYDNYGSYIRDQMRRDEALERALQTCLAHLGRARAPGPMAEAPPGDVDLDEIAERFGYDPEGEGP